MDLPQMPHIHAVASLTEPYTDAWISDISKAWRLISDSGISYGYSETHSSELSEINQEAHASGSAVFGSNSSYSQSLGADLLLPDSVKEAVSFLRISTHARKKFISDVCGCSRSIITLGLFTDGMILGRDCLMAMLHAPEWSFMISCCFWMPEAFIIHRQYMSMITTTLSKVFMAWTRKGSKQNSARCAGIIGIFTFMSISGALWQNASPKRPYREGWLFLPYGNRMR